MLRALVITCVLVLASTVASAEALGAMHVGVADPSRFYKAGGLTRWLEARAKLDAEHGTYKPAEEPPGTEHVYIPEMDDFDLPPEAKEKIRREVDRIRREEQSKDVWRAHEAEMLGPIELDVQVALARFAKDHGIGIILDRGKLDAALLVVAVGVDVTDAFIKDYNARNAPKPARH